MKTTLVSNTQVPKLIDSLQKGERKYFHGHIRGLLQTAPFLACMSFGLGAGA